MLTHHTATCYLLYNTTMLAGYKTNVQVDANEEDILRPFVVNFCGYSVLTPYCHLIDTNHRAQYDESR